MKGPGGLAAALLLAVFAAGCAASSPVPQGDGPTPCDGSTSWPPLGYTATLPAGVEVTWSGPLATRVVNSGATAIHVRASAWGLGTCTGWVSFSPDQSADIAAHAASDFVLADPSSSGIPFRVGVEVWSPACSGSCPEPPTGFWSGPLTPPSQTQPAPTEVATPAPSASSAPGPTVGTSLAARCVRNGSTALAGVVEARPDGWSDRAGVGALPGFPATSGRVYGPAGAAVPPDEGPGRLVLYETIPADGAYFRSRADESRSRGGRPIAVTVCGEATEAWLDESTGELVVGWTDRDKSDVLVANTADFTVQELVVSAESVYDCCG